MKNNTEESLERIRIHRVGSVTAGICVVGFGVLFMLHTVCGLLDYRVILDMWPLVLIGMGVELLLSNLFKGKIVYDKAAIVLLFVMTLFAVALTGVDVFMEVVGQHWNI